MNLDTIEKLIKFMEQHGLSELSVREGELEFKARRGERTNPPIVVQQHSGLIHSHPNSSGIFPPLTMTPPQGTPAVSDAPPVAAEKPKTSRESKEICSPIVGTFYRRPNPNSPPFKEVGDKVDKNDVICIVEAMKVMNEIKAEVSGTVVKVLADDAKPVEYGQPLFLVEPD